MNNKIPQDILKLLKRRKNYAGKVLILESDLQKRLKEIGFAETPEYLEFFCDYGCLMYTKPYVCYSKTIEMLQNFFNENSDVDIDFNISDETKKEILNFISNKYGK